MHCSLWLTSRISSFVIFLDVWLSNFCLLGFLSLVVSSKIEITCWYLLLETLFILGFILFCGIKRAPGGSSPYFTLLCFNLFYSGVRLGIVLPLNLQLHEFITLCSHFDIDLTYVFHSCNISKISSVLHFVFMTQDFCFFV